MRRRKRELAPLAAAALILLAAFCLPELAAWRQDAARPGQEPFDESPLQLKLDGGLTYPERLRVVADLGCVQAAVEPDQMNMSEDEVLAQADSVLEVWFSGGELQEGISPELWLNNEMPEPIGMWSCWGTIVEDWNDAANSSAWISLYLDDASGRLLRISYSGTNAWRDYLRNACAEQGWEPPAADGGTGTAWEEDAWALLTLFLEGKTEGTGLEVAYEVGGITYYLFSCQVDGETVSLQIEVSDGFWAVNNWRTVGLDDFSEVEAEEP